MTTPEPTSGHRHPPGDPTPEAATPRISLAPLHFPYPGPRGNGVVVILWCVVVVGVPCAASLLYASFPAIAFARGGGVDVWLGGLSLMVTTGLLIVPPIGWIASRRRGMRRSQIGFGFVWLVGLTLLCGVVTLLVRK